MTGASSIGGAGRAQAVENRTLAEVLSSLKAAEEGFPHKEHPLG
jgi:hypothetical protein